MSFSSTLVTKLPLWCSNPNPTSVSITIRASASEANNSILRLEGTKERIKKLFENKQVELSVSCYDTAWVAMVPQPGSPQAPCFPQCVNWLLQNQQQDGSWTHHDHDHHDLMLTKDALSSTLASVLALKKWGLGDQQITRGLQFIESNGCSITDEKQQSPIGFDIIFPGMIEYAQDMNVKLPLRPTDIEAMLQKRDLELTTKSNSEGRRAYLAYVSEGLMGKLQEAGYDHEMVMKYQRKNGSLFNSPSTTAAALSVHAIQNVASLDYLHSLVNNNPNHYNMDAIAVPTVYPLRIYSVLSMIDTLKRLGIEPHFENEIRTALDETYRWWILGEEEIFMDTTTCAMAFRLLREHGYQVSSDPLAPFADEGGYFLNTLEGYLKDTKTILELHKASQMIIHSHELFLEQLNSWTTHFLKHQQYSSTTDFTTHANGFNKNLFKEVDEALKFSYYTNLESLAVKKNIEHYDVDSTRILKTSYRSPYIGNIDFMKLAAENFNIIQSDYREELEDFRRWVVEKRLDKLIFQGQKLEYCYLAPAAALYSPLLSDARKSWCRNAILTAVIDDLFDTVGHDNDKLNIVNTVNKWNVDNYTTMTPNLSELYQIFYSALRDTIQEVGESAQKLQERSVTSHLIKIWSDILDSMLKESEWKRSKLVPSIEEYMLNGYMSFALQPSTLPTQYFIGPKISPQALQTIEFHNIDKTVGTIGRLLNDIVGYQREAREGKLNAVSLRVIHSNGGLSEEEAIKEIKSIVERERRELLRMVVLQRRGHGLVPRACVDFFWTACKVVHLFYSDVDQLHSLGLLQCVQQLIHEPLLVPSHDDVRGTN